MIDSDMGEIETNLKRDRSTPIAILLLLIIFLILFTGTVITVNESKNLQKTQSSKGTAP